MDHPPHDAKDWTWVLEQQCPQCGFDAGSVERSEIPALMRANAAAFRAALGRGDIVEERPPVMPGSPPKWSALEYGAHVRDVYTVAIDRMTRMIKKTAPTFADWNQDEAAMKGNYSSADPAKVSYELAVNAGKMADMLERVRDGEWERTGTRSDGAKFTIGGYAAYILHDVTHHLWDIEQGFKAIKEAREDG